MQEGCSKPWKSLMPRSASTHSRPLPRTFTAQLCVIGPLPACAIQLHLTPLPSLVLWGAMTGWCQEP